MTDSYDFDAELEAVERFIAAVQAGQIGTSEAMAAYRDRHRPAIDRLRAELASFRALLEEAEAPGPEAAGDASGEVAARSEAEANPLREPGEGSDAADLGTAPTSAAPDLWQAGLDDPGLADR
jgi:hypothetical protein